MSDTRKMPIRLALRHEGSMWNAYVAKAENMEGAFLIGSIAINAARHQHIHDAFKALMTEVLKLAITDVTGAPPDEWTEQLAPPHEKAGHS